MSDFAAKYGFVLDSDSENEDGTNPGQNERNLQSNVNEQ